MLGKIYYAALAAALLLTASVSTAQAFCRTMSCQLGEAARTANGGRECARDENWCVDEGAPLHWASPCIYYAVQADGSRNADIDAATFQEAIDAAFSAWQGVACPHGGSPRFHAQFQDYVRCDRRETVCGGASANVNVFMFQDELWPAGAGVIGLTTPSGGTQSGLVVDADLELNARDYRYSTGAMVGDFQLREVLTHEVGHFLGLDHSNARGALMSEDYQMLQLSRELLTDDDISAICAAYPPGPPLSCAAAGPPAYDECQLGAGESPPCQLASMSHDRGGGGCAMAPGSSGAVSGYAAFGLLLALMRRRGSVTIGRRPFP